MIPIIHKSSNDEEDSMPSYDSSSDTSPKKFKLSTTDPRTLLRLLPRDLPYDQSKNKLKITTDRGHDNSFVAFTSLIGRDWFHYLLRQPTVSTVLSLLTVWIIVIFIFAGVYMGLDRLTGEENCGLGPPDDPIRWGPAFAFSLETCTTVGYGLPGDSNAFFESNCPSVQSVIAIQMMASMMFNAFLFAFFFARLSRCETRGGQVLFGSKAIIRKDTKTGRLVFEVRCYDADSGHPIVEAHVRLYCIRHGNKAITSTSTEYRDMDMDFMRIVSPNDDLGGVLFTSAPSNVIHDIDSHSPLLPPAPTSCQQQGCCAFESNGMVVPYQSGYVMNTGHLIMRDIDSCAGDRDGLHCVVCGESYGSVERLIRHVKYQIMVETKDEYPVKGSHRELDPETMFAVDNITSNNRPIVVPQAERPMANEERSTPDRTDSEDYGDYEDVEVGKNETMSLSTATTNKKYEHVELYDSIRQHMANNNLEILCVIEGIDPLLSGTFQSLQSYSLSDIAFGGTFAPCVIPSLDKSGKMSVKVDLDRFHAVVPEQ